MNEKIRKAKNAIRFRERIGSVLCYLPDMGLIPKASSLRPNGISLTMAVKNEEDWIGLSLLSIKDFADEIIITDNGSTDNTLELINVNIRKHNLNNVKVISLPDASIYDLRNIGLKNTHYRWIVRWDGDMIARTSGPNSIMKLRKKILSLPAPKYYIIYYSHICLDGDLFHQIKGQELHQEDWIFTYSAKICYTTSGRFAELIVPLYYKRLYWNENCSFHLRNVKSARQRLSRNFWSDWREHGNYEKFPTLDKYIQFRIKKDWGLEDIREAEIFLMKNFCKQLVPYDRATYGEYPELLKDRLKNPKYKIIYRDGEIVGRNDIL